MKFSQFSDTRRMLLENFDQLSEQQKIDCVTKFSKSSPREFATIFEQLPAEVRQEFDTYNGDMAMLVEASVFDPTNLTIARRRGKYTPVFVSLLQDNNGTLKIHPKFAPLYSTDSIAVNNIKNKQQLLDFLHKSDVGPTKQWPTIDTKDGRHIKIYHLLKTGQFRVVADHSTDTNTNIKEGLVSVMYKCLQSGELTKSTTFTIDNLTKQIVKAMKCVQSSIGENAKSLQQLSAWLSVQAKMPTKVAVETLQQTLSQAVAIYEAYPKAKLDRSQIFDSVRQMGSTITMIPKDKWNPGDIYVILPGAPAKIANTFTQIGETDDPATKLQLLNNLFVHDWGESNRAIVSVSLKLAEAQGGKAKDFLKTLSPDATNYNITKQDLQMSDDQLIIAIMQLRKRLKAACASSDSANIVYQGNVNVSPALVANKKRLREKYACLKQLVFALTTRPNQSIDNVLIAILGFALSLSGVNPTFFKIHAVKTLHTTPIVQKFSAGGAITLHPSENNQSSLITIDDKESASAIYIYCKIEKGESICDVKMESRVNGYAQATLEITRIKCTHIE